MGEGTRPLIPSPDSGNDLAGFLGTIGEPALAVLERTTTSTTTDEKVDFRLEFKCQKNRHYARQLRGRGKNRTAEMGNFKHLGLAEVVAQRGGYYAVRWREYQSRHRCSYG